MQSIRVIPCLDVDGGRVVKGINFVDIVDAGDPVELATYYDSEGADELVFLDITASNEMRFAILDVVERTAEKVFVPLTVGGGVTSVEGAGRLLRAGADKVSINSAAIARPELISELAERYGSQCVVVAIDAKANGSGYGVYSHGGRVRSSLDAVDWAIEAQRLGAGELLVTSMDRDGTKQGYELNLLKRISESTSIPIIASGGVGRIEHFSQGVLQGGAQGLLAASVFHFGEFSIVEVKESLMQAGLNVRPVA